MDDNTNRRCEVEGARVLTTMIAIVGSIVILLLFFSSCSPRIIERVETKIEVHERIVYDTATFEVPVEIEKIVTCDTISHLENNWAKSDAIVSGGLLHHSLESKPQIIKIPVEVTVRDTIKEEAKIIEKEVKVEKPLSWSQKTKIGVFWYLLGAVIVLLLWVFRKQLLKLL